MLAKYACSAIQTYYQTGLDCKYILQAYFYTSAINQSERPVLLLKTLSDPTWERDIKAL